MKKMFEEEELNGIKLRNRFIRSGTWTAKATEDGEVTDELINYYEKLAKGNLGMVTVGYSRILEDEKANNNMIGIWDDKFIPGLKKLTQMFHENNTPVGIQLAIGGSQIHYIGDVTWKIMAPSPIDVVREDSNGNEIVYKVKEMTKEEINFIIDAYAAAALRVKKAGFDAVQIHAGHGYFAGQWMNPKLNQREDEYGQDRTKFIIDLYTAIRNKVGEDYTVTIKINSEEEVGSFENHENMLDLCTKLDNLGINLIEVSGANPSRTKRTNKEEGYFQEFAHKLTQRVKCKTMLTGGNKSFETIENILNTTGVDFIGLSRVLVSESDLVSKWQEDPKYSSRCMSCNHCHRVINTCVFDVEKSV